MTARTFTSAKQAISYALAARAHAAAAATRRESEASGATPDQWLVSSIFACLTIGGVDPHGGSELAASIFAWATQSDGSDEELERGADIGEAIRRVAAALRQFEITVEPNGEPLPTIARRPLVLDGRVVYVRCTEGPASAEPVECSTVKPDRAALRARDVEQAVARIDAGERAETVDADLAERWAVSPVTAYRWRRAAGHRIRRAGRPLRAGAS